MAKKSDFVGKKFRVYQGEKLEGLAKVEHVEILYAGNDEAFCRVRFDTEPEASYHRWIILGNRVREE